ncbi:MAG: hypothetical protein GX897_08850 [Clostridiales bacterium]|nr:hypothetical protein [Clostridiales bacterium]
MNNKVLLIISDGVRPDAIGAVTGKKDFSLRLLQSSYYTMNARTVMPSVTLPCHMSLFHSVPPERHGIMTNTYVPQVRPVKGLFEVLRAAGKNAGIVYDWEELRDLGRPDSIGNGIYMSGHIYDYNNTCVKLTEKAIEYINECSPDFVFYYYGLTDAAGHGHGWMSDEYMSAVSKVSGCIEHMLDSISGYTVIFTADHGGHSRGHGSDIPEDMTIPIIISDPSLEQKELGAASILDIAPTVTDILGVSPDPEWEGKSLIR